MATSLPANASPEDHAEVLHRYNPDNKPWPGISDDGYLYDHLAENLVGSERQEELRALFSDDRWLGARVAQGGYEGYLDDMDVAWNIAYQQATNQIDQGETPTALIDCVLYTLIQTTINSIMGNYVPALVKRALETELWTTSQVKRIAERITDPERRAELYQTLGVDDESSDNPVNAETEASQEPFDTQHPTQPEDSSPPQQLMLEQFMSVFSDELRTQMLDAIDRFANPAANISEVNNLSPHLDGEERAKSLEAKLDEVLTISDELVRANALSHLAEHLSDVLIDRVLDAIAAIRQEKWRPRVLASLSPQANEAQLARILEMALDIHDKWHRAFALEAFAHHAPPDMRDQALRAILAIDDEEGVSRALQHAGYLFSGELLVQALEKARAFTQDEYCSVALAGIADQFAPDQRAVIRAEAKQAAERVDDPQARADSMAALAVTVNEADRAEALAQQLTAIACIASDEKRSEALIAAIPNLPDALLAEALDIALSIDKVNEHVSYTCAVEDLAPRLNDEQLKRALNDAVNVADGADCVAALVQLYTHVDSSRQRQVARFAFESMMAIRADWVRAQALGEVFGILDEGQRDKAWAHAQSILPDLPHNEVPIKMLVSIAAAFEGARKRQVVDRAREFVRHIFAEKEESRVFFQNEGIMSVSMLDNRPAMLVLLAGQVEQPERSALLQEALDMIDASADKWLHFKLMEPISTLAEGELRERVTALAKQIHLPYSHKREATRMPPESEGHPHEPDENSSLHAARRNILSTLAEIRNSETREALLSQYKLMFENTVPPLSANQIADQLIAVCRDWQWPAG